MADAGRSGELIGSVLRQLLLEIGELSCLLGDFYVPVAICDGDTRRVVPAIFHPAKRFYHDWQRLLMTDVSDDSAHSASG